MYIKSIYIFNIGLKYLDVSVKLCIFPMLHCYWKAYKETCR